MVTLSWTVDSHMQDARARLRAVEGRLADSEPLFNPSSGQNRRTRGCNWITQITIASPPVPSDLHHRCEREFEALLAFHARLSLSKAPSRQNMQRAATHTGGNNKKQLMAVIAGRQAHVALRDSNTEVRHHSAATESLLHLCESAVTVLSN